MSSRWNPAIVHRDTRESLPEAESFNELDVASPGERFVQAGRRAGGLPIGAEKMGDTSSNPTPDAPARPAFVEFRNRLVRLVESLLGTPSVSDEPWRREYVE